MNQTIDPIRQAADILAARRRSGEQGERLPEHCRPAGIASALAVQAAVAEQLAEHAGAWKCGTPAEDRVVLAPIHASTVSAGFDCRAQARDGTVRVEPELAFVLGTDLPARAEPYTRPEVDAAIAGVHLALELIDSRYRDPTAVSFAENLADGLLNQGLCLGPSVDKRLAQTAARLQIEVSDENGDIKRLDGRHPNDEPCAPLYWLAEYLRLQGRGLRAGQAVITGSYAGSFTLPLEQEFSICFGALGLMKVRFAQR